MNDNEGRMYALVRQDLWADDATELRPERIKIPNEIHPWVVEGEVEDPSDLHLYTYEGEAPRFMDEDAGLQANEEEINRWKAKFSEYKQAEAEYVEMVRAAKVEYDRRVETANSFLAAAFAGYKPSQDEQLARSAELAVSLAGHRKAAEEWEVAQEEKRQAVLDSQFGPRDLVLYPPKDLDSPRQGDHLARVHMKGCSRRRGSADDPMRAKDAVERLRDPSKWLRSPYSSYSHAGRYEMVVKLCSFCKPWKLMMEHTDVTPRNFGFKLAEWPSDLA